MEETKKEELIENVEIVSELTPREKVLKKIENKEKLGKEDIVVIRQEYTKFSYTVQEKLGTNWFKIGKFARTFNMTNMDALNMLITLVQLELAVAKAKANHNEFKIDIDKVTMKQIIEKELEEKKQEVEFLEGRLKDLS